MVTRIYFEFSSRSDPDPACTGNSTAPKDIQLLCVGIAILLIGVVVLVKVSLTLIRCLAAPSPLPPSVLTYPTNPSPDQRCTNLAAKITAKNNDVEHDILIQEMELEQLLVESHPLPIYASNAIQLGVAILVIAYVAHWYGLVDLSAVLASAYILFDPNFLLVLIAINLVYNRLICTAGGIGSAIASQRIASMLSFFAVGFTLLFGGYSLCICALAAESYGTGFLWIVSCPYVTSYIASVCTIFILIATSITLYHS